MSMNVIAHNIAAMNAERFFKTSSKSKKSSAEKLSSGYRINRAADDAAGLSISEGMRRAIRGLKQGTENAQYGISWVKIGDGALGEAHDILHRMTELSVKSLNGTWTESDRAAMQVEFDQLQSELDRLTDEARFNEKHIFAEHEYPYYQFEGNVKWPQSQRHMVLDGANDLTVTYQMKENQASQTATITVPAGYYTTQELVDEIDTALEEAGLWEQGVMLEYTADGYCNLNLEGGAKIEKVTGGLEYLLHDVYEGGSAGALIGTTQFMSDTARLPIYAGINDNLSFEIINLDGVTKAVDLTVPKGDYTRRELIDLLNQDFTNKNVNVQAIEFGKCIKLISDDSIITRLKGNMFKVDDEKKGEQVATSIFYDNIGYGTVTPINGSFRGGAVLTTDFMDVEHQHFNIDSTNNTLLIQANGSKDVKTLKIPEGSYTAEQMRDLLNNFFKSNGLDLTASVFANVGTPYRGLEIVSNVKGPDSKVGIDKTSSAYKTLFVTRGHNQMEIAEKYDRDKRNEQDPYFLGGKTFNENLTSSSKVNNLPLTVNAGKNDKFMLNVDNELYEITLAAGKYGTRKELMDALNKSIQDLAGTVSDAGKQKKLQSVKVYINQSPDNTSDAIMLKSRGEGVTVLTASACAGNTGYAELFTTSISSVQDTAVSKDGVAVLNTPVTFPATVSSSEQTLTVNLDGKDYNVTVPAGTYQTPADLLKALKNLPTEGTEQIPNTFKTIDARGSDNTFKGVFSPGSITPPSSPVEYAGTGDSDVPQGVAATPTWNKGAQVSFKIPKTNSGKTEIDSSNNKLTIEINGVSKTVTLDNGSYDLNGLAAQLQKKLDDAFGSNFGGATVKPNASKNQLELVANLKRADGTEQNGRSTNIKCSSASSSFLKDINTQKVYATLSLGKNLKVPATIASGKNTFTFTYEKNGASRDVTVTLPAGTTYTSGKALCDAMNEQLQKQNVEVRAFMNGSRMALQATKPGSDYKLAYDSKKGGTCVTTIFQNADTEAHPAKATISDTALQGKIEIKDDSREFKMLVDSGWVTVQLDKGTYTPATFVNMLKQKLSGKGVTPSLSADGKHLEFVTTREASDARIYMPYANGGSSMEAIFGTTPYHHNGVKAEFTSDNKLQLTAVKADGTIVKDSKISVSSTKGSIFQKPKGTGSIQQNPKQLEGYHSNKYSYMQGAPLAGNSVEITRWNSDLHFRYHYMPNYYSTTYRDVSITLDEGTYTFSQLQTELQKKLDASLGKGMLTAQVSSDGVKISAGKPGRPNYIDEDTRYTGGGFFYNVIRRAPEKKETLKPEIKDGTYDNTIYAVGRKDIRHQGAKITKGINDTLSLDFTYGNKVYPISMTLSSGNYTGESLVKEIQEKLDEQLVKAGLPKGIIEAQIGGIHTGVVGSDDKNALVFKLTDKMKLPNESVVYKIDAIGGNAAFGIFYQTDGDMQVAYVQGTKDISKGVTIPEDEEFSFDVDGTNYTVTVPAGEYSADEIVDYLNTEFKGAGVPVKAKTDDGNLILSHTKYGKHQITNVTGEARQYLFFRENGKSAQQSDIWIRLSGTDSDGVTITRPIMNTKSLGINSIAVSRPKYAEKALTRLKTATSIVSGTRTMFGTMQNRLEHKIRSNENAAENTQAAESIIRDTDIAKEVVKNSQAAILGQVSQAMETQANQSRHMVLDLLQ